MKIRLLHFAIVTVALLISACGGGTQAGGNVIPPPAAPGSPVKMGGAVQGKALSLDGTVSTLAGSTTGVDGTGAGATFVAPLALATDGTCIFVCDADNTIRKITIATGAVTTLAGQHGVFGFADGIGSAAAFSMPSALVVVGGDLFVADSWNRTIRRIEIATGAVTTLAGNPTSSTGFVDGVGANAVFRLPMQMATDGTSLFVADMGGNLRKVEIATGKVTTLKGGYFLLLSAAGGALYAEQEGRQGDVFYKIDTGTGSTIATTTNSTNPSGMVSDGINLFIADTSNNTILKMDFQSGLVTTLAGHSGATSAVDGVGAAAGFLNPTHITSDGANLYLSDANSIRKVVIATGEVSTIAGVSGSDGFAAGTVAKLSWTNQWGGVSRNDGSGAAARFLWAGDVTTDGTSLFVTDQGGIRKVDIATGAVSSLPGTAGLYQGPDSGGVAGITTDGRNLYLAANTATVVYKINIATGAVSTLAGKANVSGSADGIGAAASFSSLMALTTDGANLYVCDYSRIRKVVIATGAVSTLAGGDFTGFGFPGGITTDGSNLYFTDSGIIEKMAISTGAVSLIAGTPPSIDGTGAAASFKAASAITTDGKYLYVTDDVAIRKVEIATGAVTTIAGSTDGGNSADRGYGFVDGAGASARFYHPSGITTDGKHLFVADTTGIRMIK